MKRPTPFIRWLAPAVGAQHAADDKISHRFAAHADAPTRASRVARVRSLIASVGVPVVSQTRSARESAIGFLQLAAEIEHALMVQYLYAGLSLPVSDGSPGATDYREKLVDIAVQEMGHLATVQNLLILLGGPGAVHLQRDVIRRGNANNPIPFVLEPVSLVALAKYVAAERPAEVPPDLRDKVEDLVKLAEKEIGAAAHRVGVLYALLHWMFGGDMGVDFTPWLTHLDEPRLADADLLPREQIDPYLIVKETDDEWQAAEDGFLLLTARSRSEAVSVIEQIAAQGEGLLNLPEASHFEEFMELVRDFESGKIAPIDLPKSPTLGGNGGEGGNTITHPYTRLWGEVFSCQYALVVLSIQHALVLKKASDDEEGLREKVTASALKRMRRVVMRVGGLLLALPIDQSATPAPAGPPYDLAPELLDELDPVQLPTKHLFVLDRLSVLYEAIVGHVDFAKYPDHSNEVTNLKTLDTSHRNLFA